MAALLLGGGLVRLCCVQSMGVLRTYHQRVLHQGALAPHFQNIVCDVNVFKHHRQGKGNRDFFNFIYIHICIYKTFCSLLSKTWDSDTAGALVKYKEDTQVKHIFKTTFD